MLTESEKKIAEAIDTYSYFVSGKQAGDTILSSLDKDFLEAYGKYKVLLITEDLDINLAHETVVAKLAGLFISGYFVGLYMAEMGKARLGPSTTVVS